MSDRSRTPSRRRGNGETDAKDGKARRERGPRREGPARKEEEARRAEKPRREDEVRKPENLRKEEKPRDDGKPRKAEEARSDGKPQKDGRPRSREQGRKEGNPRRDGKARSEEKGRKDGKPRSEEKVHEDGNVRKDRRPRSGEQEWKDGNPRRDRKPRSEEKGWKDGKPRRDGKPRKDGKPRSGEPARTEPAPGGGATEPTWVFGPARVAETLQTVPEQVRRVLLRTGRLEPRHQALLKIARARGVPVHRLPNDRLDRLAARLAAEASGGAAGPPLRHQGAAAEVSPVRWGTLPDLLASDPPPDLLLLLDRIEDPRNFGALVRTADGAGVDAVLVPRRGAAPPSPVAVAASAGSLASARLVRVSGAGAALLALRRAGFWTVGLTPKGAAPWHEFDWTQPVALVVGSEGRGLRPGVSARCDLLLSLPQAGSARSLNVSVAAGIALYEAVRQRAAARAAGSGGPGRSATAPERPAGDPRPEVPGIAPPARPPADSA